MADRVFYDTCMFAVARDAKNPLLDLRRVVWAIVLSEISYAEATITERLNELKVGCARQGIDFIVVKMAEIQVAMRRHRGVSRELAQLGMQSRDLKQVFAASSAQAILLITRDFDFLDPASKSKKNRSAPGQAVARLIRDGLDIEVLLPKAAVQRLLTP